MRVSRGAGKRRRNFRCVVLDRLKRVESVMVGLLCVCVWVGWGELRSTVRALRFSERKRTGSIDESPRLDSSLRTCKGLFRNGWSVQSSARTNSRENVHNANAFSHVRNDNK